MDLNTLWFILIAVLFAGYFFLEGFDYGVGILMPFLGKDDKGRRLAINAIGPHWDGNEVWLLVAGGATFAAFPHWYATLFSGFYLALLLMLLGLIVRAVALEYRSKDQNPRWRALWDWLIFVGSLLPAFLWGVAFANIVRGVPIDASMNYVGSFWTLLNPYALLGGLVTLGAFMLHGALFLHLKTEGALSDRARGAAWRLWPAVVLLAAAFLLATWPATDLYAQNGSLPLVLALLCAVALLAAGLLLRVRRTGWAFALMGVTIVLLVAFLMTGLFPRVMVSRPAPANSLTIYTASSTPYTLKVMTIVAAIMVPLVLVYQAWSYWIFRKRLRRDDILEY
ncbi:MAG TPA: cytochrome d ubiquinol oxidase subunit II [Anaerolineae bacterium]|nr:cytochrome d ubiquinol oxidase subunit II [Anaerolineae bacterium]